MKKRRTGEVCPDSVQYTFFMPGNPAGLIAFPVFAPPQDNDRNQRQINQSGCHISLEELEVCRRYLLNLGKKIRVLNEKGYGGIFQILDDLVGQ